MPFPDVLEDFALNDWPVRRRYMTWADMFEAFDDGGGIPRIVTAQNAFTVVHTPGKRLVVPKAPAPRLTGPKTQRGVVKRRK